MTMTGRCIHGVFNLAEGCPRCVAEARAAATCTGVPARLDVDTAGVQVLAGPQPDGSWRDPPVGNPAADIQVITGPEIVVATIQVAPEKDPRLVAMKAEAQRLLEYASNRNIATEADLAPATDDLSIIARVKKAVTERRKAYVDPIRKHLDAVNEAFKAFLAPLEEADRLNRDKLTAFNKSIEEQRRKIAEIEAKKLALAREEAALKGGEITVDLTPIPTPPPAPRKVSTDGGSATTVPHRTWEVVDFKLLPDEYKMPDAAKIGRVVRAGIPSIPGIHIIEGTTLRVNTK